MAKNELFEKVEAYFKRYPDLKKIMKQLEIDEESYFRALLNMKSNVIVPKSLWSNKTYKF